MVTKGAHLPTGEHVVHALEFILQGLQNAIVASGLGRHGLGGRTGWIRRRSLCFPCGALRSHGP